MNKKIILILLIIIFCCISSVYALDPLVTILQNIPSSLYVYKYLTIILAGAFFWILPPFISWYFKYKKDEQDRYEKIYLILFKMCDVLEKIPAPDNSGITDIKNTINTGMQIVERIKIEMPNHKKVVEEMKQYMHDEKKQDVINKMIGRDENPKTLQKYRKFD